MFTDVKTSGEFHGVMSLASHRAGKLKKFFVPIDMKILLSCWMLKIDI